MGDWDVGDLGKLYSDATGGVSSVLQNTLGLNAGSADLASQFLTPILGLVGLNIASSLMKSVMGEGIVSTGADIANNVGSLGMMFMMLKAGYDYMTGTPSTKPAPRSAPTPKAG